MDFGTGVALGWHRRTMRLAVEVPMMQSMIGTGIEVGSVAQTVQSVPAAQPRRHGSVRVPGFGPPEQRAGVRHLVIFRAPIVGCARPAAAGAR